MEPRAGLSVDAVAADREFFSALTAANTQRLKNLLTDDFVLIDVMRGGEINKEILLAAIEGKQVRFETIEPKETRVRRYHSTSVVTGRTEMRGYFGEAPFVVRSRYTHVFVEVEGRLRLASAQGTQIVED